jgi:copper binding plastocyanin/azurin family protein
MKRAIFPLLLLFLALAPLQAQNHIINVAGFSFIDSVTGNTNTTVNCGDTIEWVLLDTIAHTVWDGASPSDPTAQSRFAFDLNSFTPGLDTFTWTATEAGTFPYFCIPHFAFGMVGTITVLPPANVRLGSGEDFRLGVDVNGVSACGGTSTATVGDIVACHFESPLATFDGFPPVLAAEIFPTGTPGPGSPVGFPYVHVTLNATIVFSGLSAPPFGNAVLQPGGYTIFGTVPAPLVGSTLRLQALALAGIANDGIFALSDSFDLDIL